MRVLIARSHNSTTGRDAYAQMATPNIDLIPELQSNS